MSNVQYPRVLDQRICPITKCRMQIVNEGNGTLKIEHPTSIANMLIVAGAVDEISQIWRMILRGFDPLMFECSRGYTLFRNQKFPPEF